METNAEAGSRIGAKSKIAAKASGADEVRSFLILQRMFYCSLGCTHNKHYCIWYTIIGAHPGGHNIFAF